MTLEEKVHGLRLHVMRRAQALGNVSQACREAGISRALFYRWQQRVERYGLDGLHPRRQHARPGRPVALSPETERLLLSVAVSAATWGAGRIATYVARRWGVRVAPSTVQRALRRAGLATRRQRLTVLEHHALQTAGLLTERTRQQLWRARPGGTRHVEAREPGELVCLDTFYIGPLKGVGKVWQITACDAACSYAVAWLLPAHTAEAAAHFLRTSLVPHYRRGLAAASRSDRWGARIPWRLRRGLPPAGAPPHAHETPACLDQWLRRAVAGHDPAGALACGLPPTLLHQSNRLAAESRRVSALLQP